MLSVLSLRHRQNMHMITLSSLPAELILHVVELIDHRPTLVNFASTSRKFREPCIRLLWQHLHIRSPKDPAIMILAITRNPKLRSHVKSVSFTCDAQSEEAHRTHSYTPCSPSCSQFPKDVEDKLAEVSKEQEKGGVTAGKICSVMESLPQILLSQLAPDVVSAYALSANVDKMWGKSLATGLCGPTTTHDLRCLCAEGRSLYQLDLQMCLQRLTIKTHSLHLYGRPIDWTLHRIPENKPTFAALTRIKLLIVSISAWGIGDDNDCNIFQRFREYHEKYSEGGLEKVVVRVTRKVSAKVCEAYDQCQWLEGRNIIEFRSWIVGDMSPDDVIARELRDGTWCKCIDSPEMLGPKQTIESLRRLAMTDHPTNAMSPSSGGFQASPSPLPQPSLPIAPKVSSWLAPNRNPIPPSIPPIRC